LFSVTTSEHIHTILTAIFPVNLVSQLPYLLDFHSAVILILSILTGLAKTICTYMLTSVVQELRSLVTQGQCRVFVFLQGALPIYFFKPFYCGMYRL